MGINNKEKYYIVEAIFENGTRKNSISMFDKIKIELLAKAYKDEYKKTNNKIKRTIIHEFDTYEQIKQFRCKNNV